MKRSDHVQLRLGHPGDPQPGEYCPSEDRKRTRTSRQRGRRSDTETVPPKRFFRGKKGRKRPQYVPAASGYQSDCWIWQGCKDRGGYGRCRVASDKMAAAHRFYYEERFGSIPDGLELHHLCGVRVCVNPEHLVAMTRHEHLRCSGKLKLTPEQVVEIRRSTETQQVVADRYEISQSQISRIKARKVWKDLPDPEMSTDPYPPCLASLAEAGQRLGQQPQPDPSISKLAA